jgi:hypothetical protein
MRDTSKWTLVQVSTPVLAAAALLLGSACGGVDTTELEGSDALELRAFFEGEGPIPEADQRNEYRHTFARQAVRASGLRRSGADMESDEGWSPLAEQDGPLVLPADIRVWQSSGDIDAGGGFVPRKEACMLRGRAPGTEGLPEEARGPGLEERVVRLACAIERLDGGEHRIEWTAHLSYGAVFAPERGAVLVNPRLVALVEADGGPVQPPSIGAPSIGAGDEGDQEAAPGDVAVPGDGPGARPQSEGENDHHPRPPSAGDGTSRTWCDRACDDVWNNSCDCNSQPGSSSNNNCDCGGTPGSSSNGCNCAQASRGAPDRNGLIVSALFAGTLVFRRGRKIRLPKRSLTTLLVALWFLACAARALAAPPPRLIDVHVTVTPAEAVLFVDGDAVTPVNGVVKVAAGAHVFSAKLDGYSPAVENTTVPEHGTGTLVTLRLVPDKGFVVITGSNPALLLAIDGVPVGKGTYSGLLAPGRHVVTAYIPAGESRSFVVDAVAGQSASVSVDGPATFYPPPPPSPPPTPVPPPRAPVPEKPRVPPPSGPYGLVNATLLWQTARPYGFDHGDTPAPGFALGGRFGYRISHLVGLEALLEYGRIANGGFVVQLYDIDQNGDGSVSGGEAIADRSPGDYLLESLRVGPLLRLMSVGSTNRLVGGIGIGALHETISLNHADLVWNATMQKYVSTGTFRHHYEGWSPYLLFEGGYERSIGKVLAGFLLQFALESVSGIAEQPYNSSVQARLGLCLRAGYAGW